MAERVLPSANFIDSYHSSYPPKIIIRPDHVGKTIHAESNRDFRTSRRELMVELFTKEKPSRKEFTESLLSEQIVAFALNPLLQPAGLSVRLAPQSLEHGTNQIGQDLLITDHRRVTYLGIDVKMRQGHSHYNRDGHKWNPHIKSPFIFLSLGSWQTEVNDQPVSYKEWLQTYAIKNLKSAKGIPHFDDFRDFLTHRIESSLQFYWERLSELEENDKSLYENIIRPESEDDRNVLYKKLSTIHSVFSEAAMNQ